MENLNFKLENFDGPLDLLLSLIRDKKMDVLEVNLAELATEYLKVMDILKSENIDLASEYLVMAATLLQIKAKTLLMDPKKENELTKDEDEILRQLAEYQRFKKISEDLREKEKERRNIYIKTSENYDEYQLPIDETKLDGQSDAVKLIMTLRKMFERTNAQKLRETTIEKFNLSPAERRLEILEILKKNKTPSFEEIFNVPTINHFVVTVLTILDMSRKQELIISQDDQFGNITFKRGEINE